jgi:hypothetical protein
MQRGGGIKLEQVCEELLQYRFYFGSMKIAIFGGGGSGSGPKYRLLKL